MQRWVIAHRGASGHGPENTLAAFRQAAELGAAFIETDLQVTRDAQFVAMHDATLERTTTGTGRVSDFTLAELKRLDAGSWFAPSFQGQRVPALDEVLELRRALDVGLYLELKYQASWALHRSLLAALNAANARDDVMVISFDPGTLDELRRLDPALMTGLLAEQLVPEPVALAQILGARILALRADLLSAALVQRAHAGDLKIVTWTVNETPQMNMVLETGVDGIMTDYPDRLRAILEARP